MLISIFVGSYRAGFDSEGVKQLGKIFVCCLNNIDRLISNAIIMYASPITHLDVERSCWPLIRSFADIELLNCNDDERVSTSLPPIVSAFAADFFAVLRCSIWSYVIKEKNLTNTLANKESPKGSIIKVKSSWKSLKKSIIPSILKKKKKGGEIRETISLSSSSSFENKKCNPTVYKLVLGVIHSEEDQVRIKEVVLRAIECLEYYDLSSDYCRVLLGIK